MRPRARMTSCAAALLIALPLFLGGCMMQPGMGYDTQRERLETLPQHYTQFDMELGWAVRHLGGRTVIDGELKNVRYAFMEDVEVWVAALTPSGRAMAKGVSYVIPRELRQDEVAPFSVTLPMDLPPGTPLRFTYRYTGSDGGDRGEGGDGLNWMQSFDTVVP